MVALQKDRIPVLVAHWSKAPFGRTLVKKIKSEFWQWGSQKGVKNPRRNITHH